MMCRMLMCSFIRVHGFLLLSMSGGCTSLTFEWQDAFVMNGLCSRPAKHLHSSLTLVVLRSDLTCFSTWRDG